MQPCTDKSKIMFSLLYICYIARMYLSESIDVERIIHLLFYTNCLSNIFMHCITIYFMV